MYVEFKIQTKAHEYKQQTGGSLIGQGSEKDEESTDTDMNNKITRGI